VIPAPRAALLVAILVLAPGCSRDTSSTATSASSTPAGARSARSPLAVPSLTIPRRKADQPIAIDGELDEPAWKTAADTGAFVDAGSGAPTPPTAIGGSARLLWDDAHLYVAFDVRDRTLTGGFPPDAVDPHLWERDTVELMIDPDGDGDNRDYFEVQVSPQNLVFDSRFDDYNLPRGGPAGPFGHQGWSAKIESAVRLRGSLDDDSDDDDGYVVELRLPWSSLDRAKKAPPAPGDGWRMNLYAMQDNGGAAWSPIRGQGNFHKASRFGRVRFGE
jgi:hypothetical protein